MADDITRLVLKVESQQVELATKRLQDLAKMGMAASKSLGGFADRSNRVSTNLGKINKATEKTDRSIKKLGESTKLTAGQMKKLRANVGVAATATGNYDRKVKVATKSTYALGGALSTVLGPLAIFYATLKAISSTIQTTAAFEKIDKQFEFITGSAENAARELEFLTESSRRNALVLSSAAGPYARLAESMSLVGLSAEDTRKLFEGTANAAATFGLSADELNGVLVAFSQVASKGTVQAEELRNQIGERIPGAFSMAAKSMGVTTKELNKMLEMGEVMAVDFLPAFAEAMSKRYSGNLEDVTATLGGNFRKATTELELFKVALTEFIGLDEGLNKILVGTTTFVRSVTEGIEDINRAADIFDLDTFISRIQVAQTRSDMWGKNSVENAEAVDSALEGLSERFDSLTPLQKKYELSDLSTAMEHQEGIVKDLSTELGNLGTELASGRPMTYISNELDVATKKMVAYHTAYNALVEDQTEITEVIPQDFSFLGDVKEPTAIGSGVEPEDGRETKRIESAYTRLQDSLMSEEEAIKASHVRRHIMATEFEELTGKDVSETREKINKDTKAKQDAIDKKKWDDALAGFSDFNTNMAVLATSGNETLNTIYKAGAIAETTWSTYQGAQAAFTAFASAPGAGPVGVAMGIAAASAATAAGLARVASITQAGSYADGGIIPGGNYNGDNLTANVNSGEMILNFAQQKKLLDMADGKGEGSSKPVTVNVVGAPAGEVEVSQSETADAVIIDIAVRRAKDEISTDIRTGSGQIEKSLQMRDRRRA